MGVEQGIPSDRQDEVIHNFRGRVGLEPGGEKGPKKKHQRKKKMGSLASRKQKRGISRGTRSEGSSGSQPIRTRTRNSGNQITQRGEKIGKREAQN